MEPSYHRVVTGIISRNNTPWDNSHLGDDDDDIDNTVFDLLHSRPALRVRVLLELALEHRSNVTDVDIVDETATVQQRDRDAAAEPVANKYTSTIYTHVSERERERARMERMLGQRDVMEQYYSMLLSLSNAGRQNRRFLDMLVDRIIIHQESSDTTDSNVTGFTPILKNTTALPLSLLGKERGSQQDLNEETDETMNFAWFRTKKRAALVTNDFRKRQDAERRRTLRRHIVAFYRNILMAERERLVTWCRLGRGTTLRQIVRSLFWKHGVDYYSDAGSTSFCAAVFAPDCPTVPQKSAQRQMRRRKRDELIVALQQPPCHFDLTNDDDDDDYASVDDSSDDDDDHADDDDARDYIHADSASEAAAANDDDADYTEDYRLTDSASDEVEDAPQDATTASTNHRLSAMGLDDMLMVAVEHAQEHLLVLHAVVRVKLAAGFYGSAVSMLHESLTSTYHQVDAAMQDIPATMTALFNLRNQLAGLWCLYAHFLCEVGVAEAAKSTTKMTTKSCCEWQACALSTLSTAVRCPLVGNHGWVAVAIVRLTLLCRGVTLRNGAKTATGCTTDAIQTALALCEDCLDRAHARKMCKRRVALTGLTAKDHLRMASFAVQQHPNARSMDPATIRALEASFLTINVLPNQLRRSPGFHFLFTDMKCAALLCTEMNRLCDLKQRLTPLSPSSPVPALILPTTTQPPLGGIEGFPLFRAAEIYDGHVCPPTRNMVFYQQMRGERPADSKNFNGLNGKKTHAPAMLTAADVTGVQDAGRSHRHDANAKCTPSKKEISKASKHAKSQCADDAANGCGNEQAILASAGIAKSASDVNYGCRIVVDGVEGSCKICMKVFPIESSDSIKLDGCCKLCRLDGLSEWKWKWLVPQQQQERQTRRTSTTKEAC